MVQKRQVKSHGCHPELIEIMSKVPEDKLLQLKNLKSAT